MPEEKDPKDVKGDGKPPEGDKGTFTQEDLDRLVPERGRRYFSGMLKELGFDSREALAASVEEFKGLKEAQMSELEKVQKRADEAEKERDLARQQAQDTAIRAALAMEAAKAGALHPEDAFQLADLSKITIDNGDVQGAVEAVAELVAGNRLVLKGRGAPDLDAGAGTGDRTGERKPPLTADEVEVAGKMGLTAEEYQQGKR